MTTPEVHVTRWWAGVFLGVVLGVSTGCTDIFGPHLPDGAIALDPIPAEYTGWWSLTETCTGLRGDLADVAWYVVPGSTVIPDSDDAVGLYQRGRGRIVLAERYVRNGFTVRHEMLHALLPVRGHPRALFLEQCGAVVSCGKGCQADAGAQPSWDLGQPLASKDELTVEVELFPPTVSLSRDTEGCLSIAVSVSNLSGEPRTVDARRGGAFRFVLDGWGSGGGGGPILADSLIALEGSKPWTWVRDCPPVVREGLAPGQYIVRGFLDGLGVLSDPATLTVVP